MRHRLHAFFRSTVRLRGEAWRFVGFGLFSYALGLGFAFVFREVFHLPAQRSVALTLAILFVLNFWLSRRFVFRAAGHAGRQFLTFVVTSLAMRGGEYALFHLLFQALHLHYLAALTAALVISNGIKFFLYRTVVFRRAIQVGAALGSSPEHSTDHGMQQPSARPTRDDCA